MTNLADFPDLHAAVDALAMMRPRLRAVQNHSKHAGDWLRYHALTLNTTAAGGRRVYVQPQYRPAGMRLDSRRLQQRRPDLYAQGRVAVPWLVANHPRAVVEGPVSEIVLPSVDRRGRVAASRAVPFAVAYDEKMRFADELRELMREETRLKAEVEAAARPYLDQGWDGLSTTFEDGYTVGLRTVKFSSGHALAVIAPVEVEPFMVETPATTVYRVLTTPPTGAEDEIDGD